MSDVSIRPGGTYLNEDQRWLYGGKQDGPNLDIVLDRSGFDLVTAFPNGFIPSGIALAEVAATGLYIPYVGETNESVSLTVDASAGTFTLTLEGDVTAALAFNATAAQVRAALEALPGIAPGDVTVTGGVGAAGGGTPYVITFVAGQHAGVDAPALTAQDVNLSGGGDAVTPVTTAGGVSTPAGEGTGRGVLFASVAYDRNSSGDIAAALCRDATVIEALLPAGHGVDAAFKRETPHLKFI